LITPPFLVFRSTAAEAAFAAAFKTPVLRPALRDEAAVDDFLFLLDEAAADFFFAPEDFPADFFFREEEAEAIFFFPAEPAPADFFLLEEAEAVFFLPLEAEADAFGVLFLPLELDREADLEVVAPRLERFVAIGKSPFHRESHLQSIGRSTIRPHFSTSAEFFF
jgi:hypothetical protein